MTDAEISNSAKNGKLSKTEVIAVASGKGGTGKTLILASLGYALIKAGHDVLMIDADPATNGLSLFLLGPEGWDSVGKNPPTQTFTSILAKYRSDHNIRVVSYRVDRLGSHDHGVSYETILSGKGLYGSEDPEVQTEAVPDLDRKTFQAGIDDLFIQIKNCDEYDYVLVDTRGGFAFESTDVCAAADSFFIVTEPDLTSFYQDRTLKERISEAAREMKKRPLLKGIIVNKSHQDEKTAAFRVELEKEFGVRIKDTYPVALDTEAIKAYQVQQIPYVGAPAARFCYDTLKAFSGLLNTVVAQWDQAKAKDWIQLVDRVEMAIEIANDEVKKQREEADLRKREFERASNENQSLRKELELVNASQSETAKHTEELIRQLKQQAAANEESIERERLIERERANEKLEALEQTLGEHRAEASRRRRLDRLPWAIIAVLSSIGAIILAFSLHNTVKRSQRERNSSGAQAQREAFQRSQMYLDRAKALLENRGNPKGDGFAVRDLAIALRLNSANSDAASLITDLLLNRTWFPPMSPILRSAGGTPLLAATFGFQDQILVVSTDGKILTRETRGTALVPFQLLASVSSKSELKLTSASFSDDGQRLFGCIDPNPSRTASSRVSATPAPTPPPIQAQFWKWSKDDNAFQAIGPYINLTGTSSFRSVTWSPDHSIAVVSSVRWTESICQIFAARENEFKDITPSKPFGGTEVALVAFDSKNKNLVATASPSGEVSLWIWDPDKWSAVAAPDYRHPFRIDARPTAMTFIPGEDKLIISFFGQPIQIWNLRQEDEPRVISPPTRNDQFIRYVFAPTNDMAAVSLAGRVLICRRDSRPPPSTPVRPIEPLSWSLTECPTEPLCTDGAVIFTAFNRDGSRIVTLSGSFWTALDAVRVWQTTSPPKDSKRPTFNFDGKAAPSWLADLGVAITGITPVASEDESNFSTIDEVRRKYSAEALSSEYRELWKQILKPWASSSEGD
jgi:cellulose biosynthesis protein BcsQ